MGGCRCVFRDCAVSTIRNPRMHFFHFPVKHRKRLLQWVEMSGQESLLLLPLSQQKNRVVCARHFRDEYFMNYKRDRLTGQAVPTLMRLGDGLALDYSKLDGEGSPELVTLEETTQPHLIPPPDFECPLELETDNELPRYRNLVAQTFGSQELPAENNDYQSHHHMNMEEASNEEFVEQLEVIEVAVPEIQPSKKPQKRIRMQYEKVVTPLKKPKILNVAAPSNVVEWPVHSVCEATTIEQHEFTKANVDVADLNSHVIVMDVENSSERLQLYEIQDISHEAVEMAQENVSYADGIDLQATSLQDVDNIKENSYSHGHSVIQETPKQPTRENVISLEQHRAQLSLLQDELAQERSKHDEATAVMQARLYKLEAALETANLQLETQRHKLTETNAQNQKLRAQVATLRQQNQQLISDNTRLEADSDVLRQESETLDVKLQAQQAMHAEVQQKCAKLEAEAVAAQQQVSTVSTSKESTAPVVVAIAPAAAAPPQPTAAVSTASLSKAQLFNGIKKYLSASMVALVRMEMFGNSEREWKPDERRASVELLRLGEQVYKYFSDEWRFRLPALRHVRLWLNECAAVEDEEDL